MIMPSYYRLMNTPPGAATAETRSMIGGGGVFMPLDALLGSSQSSCFAAVESAKRGNQPEEPANDGEPRRIM
jgi:hypothetical protein